MNFSILTGDVVEVLPTLPPNSFDAALCDPPYGLEFMGKEWDKLFRTYGPGSGRPESPSIKERGEGWQPGSSYGGRAKQPRCRRCGKLIGRGDGTCKCPEPIANTRHDESGYQIQFWHEAWAEQVFRVLKPGAMLLAFGGSRTHHRLMCALEDAGFEIRDTLCWLYGSGFPKSLDISKSLDKAAGAEREVLRAVTGPRPGNHGGGGSYGHGEDRSVTAPSTDLAKRWQGYGSALKPAFEPCIVAMKPLDGTFAANAQKWGVAGINVDGSRIGSGGQLKWANPRGHGWSTLGGFTVNDETAGPTENPSGRWPANVILGHSPECQRQRGLTHCNNGFRCLNVADGVIFASGRPGSQCGCDCRICSGVACAPDCAARQLDQMSGDCPSGAIDGRSDSRRLGYGFGKSEASFPASNGGPSRYFYTAKVSTAEREGSDHPTMKPIDLTRYLAKLILPPQRETPRRILVPFAGVGSEMIGAILAGWDEVVGIEKDEKYAAKARERIVGTAPLFLSNSDEMSKEPLVAKVPHRWSGWPGAWCLDCGREDVTDVCIATHGDLGGPCPTEEHSNGDCPEPGSKRHDPYARSEDAARKQPSSR